MAFTLPTSSGAAFAAAAMALDPTKSTISAASTDYQGNESSSSSSSRLSSSGSSQGSSSSSSSFAEQRQSSATMMPHPSPLTAGEESDFLSNSSSSYAPSTSTSRSPSSSSASSASSSIASSPSACCSPNIAIDRTLPIHPNQEHEFFLDAKSGKAVAKVEQQQKEQDTPLDRVSQRNGRKSKGRARATAVQRYAADIVRKEAKALLDLANRLDAAGDDEDEAEDDSEEEEEGEERERAQSTARQQEDLFSSLPNATLFQAVNAISSMQKHGKLVLTGVGKSGLLARKAVATFNSLGIQSVFMHPVEALHGDVGIVSPYGLDTVIMVSYSGRTKELLSLIHLVRHKGCHSIIAVTKPESPLALASDITLDASVQGDEEVDEAVPAPTSSVITALAILDSLALSLLRTSTGWDADGTARRQVFAANHPGGSLGQTLVHSI